MRGFKGNRRITLKKRGVKRRFENDAVILYKVLREGVRRSWMRENSRAAHALLLSHSLIRDNRHGRWIICLTKEYLVCQLRIMPQVLSVGRGIKLLTSNGWK